jgi:hypothetical protein
MEEIGYKQDSLGALQVPRIAWKTVFAVVLATALVAICAHIAIPLGFTPVPVTMQTFAVLLLALLFGPGPAFACLTLYLMEGAVGLPVFSPSLISGRGCVYRARQHCHSYRRRNLARAAHPLEVVCRLHPVGRAVPRRRCRQGPRCSGLCQPAWIIRQRFRQAKSLRLPCQGLLERIL